MSIAIGPKGSAQKAQKEAFDNIREAKDFDSLR